MRAVVLTSTSMLCVHLLLQRTSHTYISIMERTFSVCSSRFQLLGAGAAVPPLHDGGSILDAAELLREEENCLLLT